LEVKTFSLSRRKGCDLASRRIASYGSVASRVMVCVYTGRGTEVAPVRWIISLRKANKGESHAYRTSFPE
jgi:uncharacterized DUF497 family protein